MQVKQGKAQETSFGYKLRSIVISPVVARDAQDATTQAIEAASRSRYDIFDTTRVARLPGQQFDFAVTLRVIEW